MLMNQVHDLQLAFERQATHAEFKDISLDILGKFLSDTVQIPIIWHPLGFIQLKLGVTHDGSSLKMHIWPSGPRMGQEPRFRALSERPVQ